MRIDEKSLLSAIKNSVQFLQDDEDVDTFNITNQSALRDKLKDKRYESDTNAREWLASWSATVVTIWLFFVLLTVVCNHDHFHLSDSVLNVLLGTTTLNVLGLSFIVLRGHFQSSSKE